jgi:hypothetical protein
VPDRKRDDQLAMNERQRAPCHDQAAVDCSDRRRRRNCQDHVYPGSNEIRAHRWQSVIVPFCPSIFDRYVLTFDEAGFA